MDDFPPPIPPSPTAQFQRRSAIEQVTCLLGAEGSADGLVEDLAGDLVAGEAEVGDGKAYLRHRVTPLAPATISTEQELDLLKRQEEYFTNTLEGIRKRIGELEAQPHEKQGRVAATAGTVRIATPSRPGQSAAEQLEQ